MRCPQCGFSIPQAFNSLADIPNRFCVGDRVRVEQIDDPEADYPQVQKVVGEVGVVVAIRPPLEIIDSSEPTYDIDILPDFTLYGRRLSLVVD